MDFFQIPRPISSTIDKIAISKVNALVNTFKELIKEVAEYYMKKNSFKEFKKSYGKQYVCKKLL